MNYTAFLTAYIGTIIFVFGAVIGSFLNVLIYRLPIGMDFKKGNSICPKCKHQLNWKDLFPLFSWIFLGGKCRYCKAPISKQYPIVEAINGTMYVLAYVFLCGGEGLEGLLTLKLVGYMIVFSALLVVSWVDFKHQIITYSMWIAIFIGGLFIVGDKLIDHSFTKDGLISRIIGLFAVFLLPGSILPKKRQCGQSADFHKISKQRGAFTYLITPILDVLQQDYTDILKNILKFLLVKRLVNKYLF